MVDSNLIGINPRLQPLGALDPATIQIDERTLLDRLSFAARYGSLIVFFDQQNQANGNWRSFFLKDPLILMAAISTTPYTPKHRLFLLLQDKLKNAKQNGKPIDWHYEDIKANPPTAKNQLLLAQLFNLINGLFDDINDWLEQMDIGHKQYPLRSFVQMQVKDSLGSQLGQLVELQKLTHLACIKKGDKLADKIPAPDFAKLDKFNPIWQTNRYNRSLTLLDADKGSKKDSDKLVIDVNILQRLEQIYHQVFGFFVQVIDSAKDSFNQLWQNLNQSRDSYADTALLVAFAQLMQVQQEQLNKLTQAHLDFYYSDILRQKPASAVADSAVVCLTLKPKTIPLLLEQGTLFDGGVNAEQQPQQFVTEQSQWLNHIQIEQVQTSHYQPKFDDEAFVSGELFLSQIKDSNKVKKDPQQQLISWPLLGSNSGIKQQQGLAIASPLLSLASGKRTITFNFTWANDWKVEIEAIKQCQFYLSGEKAFLSVTPSNVHKDDDTHLRLAFELAINQPAIMALAKNPDGYSSKWPLFKWLMSDTIDLSEPPVISQVEIEVQVDGFNQLELYNDDGKLAPDAPFMPFGAIPDKGARFYLGSNEVFAKPLKDLKLQVQWSGLPDNMCKYYETYNRFLDNQFSQQDSTTVLYPPLGPFNNGAFKGSFSIFNHNTFEPVNASNSLPTTKTKKAKKSQVSLFNQYMPAKLGWPFMWPWPNFLNDSTLSLGSWEKTIFTPDPKPWPAPIPWVSPITCLKPTGLFLKKLSPDSVFSFKLNDFTGEPNLTLAKLDFSQPLKNGFMQLQLSAPAHGFGNPIYAQVVTAVTLENAYRIIKINKGDNVNEFKDFKALKAKGLHEVVDEDEEQKSSIGHVLINSLMGRRESETPKSDPQNGSKLAKMPNLPYAPIVSAISMQYKARETFTLTDQDSYPCELFHYDCFSNYKASPTSKTFTNMVTAGQSPHITSNGDITLIPGVSKGGCLYLGLDNIEPPCNLSLYFQLNHLVAYGIDNSPQPLDFYYLSNKGWQPLRMLCDGTDNLNCSGIVEVFLPEDISRDPTLLPFDKPADETTGERAWLAIAGQGNTRDYAQVAYLNTQAVKVTRKFIEPWTSPESPTLAADSISGLVVANPAIEAVSQPFAASGGSGLQSQNQYYRSVSERIGNKDRVVAKDDLATLAYQFMPSLYFCKTIKGQTRQAPTQIVLVQGYESMQADALKPVVNGCQLDKLKQFFAKRLSPMLKIKLINPSYQLLSVTATLKFAPNVAVQRVCQQINQALIIYLSPWIKSDLPQRAIDKDLTSGELIEFFTQYSEVVEVASLIAKVGDNDHNAPFTLTTTEPDLLVAASTQHISQAGAA